MAGAIEVSAKKTIDGEAKTALVTYDFGEDLNEMVEKFTDNIVFTNARANMKIVLQAGLRRCLEAGQDPADFAAAWKPGVQMERIVDPIAAAKAKYAAMSEEDRAAFLKDLAAL
jgi:hypothetical protein